MESSSSSSMSNNKGLSTTSSTTTTSSSSVINKSAFIIDSFALRYMKSNDIGIIFVACYHKLIAPLYIDDLFEKVSSSFISKYSAQIPTASLPFTNFKQEFERILKDVEYSKRPGNSSGANFANILPSNSSKALQQKVSTDDNENNKSENENNSNLNNDVQTKTQAAMKRRVKGSSTTAASSTVNTKKKEERSWTDPSKSKVSAKDMELLDYSAKSSNNSTDDDDAQFKKIKSEFLDENGVNISDLDREQVEPDNIAIEDEEIENSEKSSNKSSFWSISRIGDAFNSITGNRELTRDDITPVLNALRTQLISKNVAVEVSDSLCSSVAENLIGHNPGAFSKTQTVVKQALQDALARILTPKRSIDILAEALASKSEKKPYTIAFVGVNGVGKSTSLAKICFYLKQKGLKCLLVACDTFRSGAIEQLKVHSRCLEVDVFERGYSKDPANVAKDGIQFAKNENYDVVLIDTAGRMQNNEPLMNALARLIDKNEPDLVLFVGEALVGNDGVNQLEMFNQAIKDYSSKKNPRGIDGIVLTKFDTIDDKVGAAVSMVHKSGQPIIFIGNGQKYTNLSRLNLQSVLKSLLN